MATSPYEVLDQLVIDAAKSGWATATMPLSFLKSYARERRWEPIATRRGDSAVSKLKPTVASEAPARSISATVGLDAQLLHVDGAHIPVMPDIVVMHSETVNLTATRIWRPGFEVVHSSAVQHGVFIVGTGRDSFLACAADDQGLRFDPYCMTPADGRSREAFTLLTSYDDVHEHAWDEPNKLLLVRNRMVLHGRAKVAGGEERELTRIGYRTGHSK
ncbi:hypothetical protein ACFYU5_08700 [Nocardia aobensis]|uniref:TauD/TfdA-like domain-containing protein n=1 Tax=Nocardia aobensis TaxID=257277 RepID=A0ABW6NZB6_9NOCA